MTTWVRSAAAAVLLVVAAFGLGLGVLATSLRGTLLETERFVRIGVSVLEQAEVRSAVARSILDRVLESAPTLPGPVRDGVLHAADRALMSDRFRAVFGRGLARLHRDLLSGDDPELALTLQDVAAIVIASLPGDADELKEFVHDDLPLKLVLLRGDDVAAVREAATLLDDLRPILPIGVVAVLLGILLAQRRWRAAALLGAGVAVVAAALTLGLGLGRAAAVEGATDGDQAVVSAVWDALARDARVWLVSLIAAGLVVLVAGLVLHARLSSA